MNVARHLRAYDTPFDLHVSNKLLVSAKKKLFFRLVVTSYSFFRASFTLVPQSKASCVLFMQSISVSETGRKGRKSLNYECTCSKIPPFHRYVYE